MYLLPNFLTMNLDRRINDLQQFKEMQREMNWAHRNR